jgi:hypothetical protein
MADELANDSRPDNGPEKMSVEHLAVVHVDVPIAIVLTGNSISKICLALFRRLRPTELRRARSLPRED